MVKWLDGQRESDMVLTGTSSKEWQKWKLPYVKLLKKS